MNENAINPRCSITGNPCCTDTWSSDQYPDCHCARILRDLAAAQEARERAEGEVERLLLDSEAAHAAMTALRDDRRRLQKALAFWMPCIAGEETPAGERVAKEAFLLFGMPQEDDEPNAQELGWIVMDSEAKLLREERNSAEALAESFKADAERVTFLHERCSVTFTFKRNNGSTALIAGPTDLRAAIDAAREPK